jgi:hypothetical protein
MNQPRVVVQSNTMLAEEVGIAWGATIVAIYACNEAHYHQLPYTVQYGGTTCYKCSYHEHTQRAYYRSNVEPSTCGATDSDIMRLSHEELVSEGYLIIERCGVMTKYIPTDKWRHTMMQVQPQPTFIHSKDGCRALMPSVIKGLLPASSGSEPTTYMEEIS